MAQIRETLEEIRKKVIPSLYVPQSVKNDIEVLRRVIKMHIGVFDVADFGQMMKEGISTEQRQRTRDLYEEWQRSKRRAENTGPDLSDEERFGLLLRRATVVGWRSL